jgi:hypothetical protein
MISNKLKLFNAETEGKGIISVEVCFRYFLFIYICTGLNLSLLFFMEFIRMEIFVPYMTENWADRLYAEYPNGLLEKKNGNCSVSSYAHGRAVGQAVSRRPVTAEVWFVPGSVRVGFVVDKVALGQVFLRVLRFSLSISFRRGSPYSYIVWGISNRPVSGRIPET